MLKAKKTILSAVLCFAMVLSLTLGAVLATLTKAFATTYSYTSYENWQIKYQGGSGWEWTDNLEEVEEGLYKIEINWKGTGFNVGSDENPIKKDWYDTTDPDVTIAEGVTAPTTVDVYLRVIDDDTLKIGIGVAPTVSVSTYAISDGTADLNGIIEIDKSTAAEKELVTITVKPASGYQLKSLTAAAVSVMARPITPTQDEQDKTKYTFTMPAHDVKVIAEFEVAAITATVAEIDCPTCHGDGLAQCSECFGLGCAACNGGNVPCTNCGETGKISFTTLEDAISAVTYYGKITLLKDNSEEIEISEEAVFIIDKASFTFDKSKITAGTGYDVSTRENGTETTFIVTQKTIASILPEDFPTFSMPLSDKVWVNANCATSKLYKNLFNGLTFGSIEQYDNFENILTAPVTKVENGYKFTKDSYTITFVMDDFDKLVQITLAGSEYADNNGNYLPPHIHTLKETYPKVDAKCEEAGHEAYYESDCGKYFSDVDLTQEITNLQTWLAKDGNGYIAPLGHHFSGGITYTWVEDECTATWYCDHTGCTQTETETVKGVYVKDTEATCELNEKGHYEATFTNSVFTKQLTAKNSVVKENTALGHHYSDKVTYTWNNDKCTATWHCDRTGCNKVETETVTGVYVKDTDATRQANEKGHYEATFTNSNFTKQVTEANSVELENTMIKGLSSGTIIALIGCACGICLIVYILIRFIGKKKR